MSRPLPSYYGAASDLDWAEASGEQTRGTDYAGTVGVDSTAPLYCRAHGSVVRTRAGCCPQCVEEAAADVAAHEERSDLRNYRQSLIDQQWRG